MTAVLTKDSLRDQTVNGTHTRPVAQGTTPHRTSVTRTGRTNPWRVDCTCGSHTEWRFWPNALRRAYRHLDMPGVFS